MVNVSKPVWHIPLLWVQRKTPDAGQRNYPEHVEFYSKNKFEKLAHLVDFIIRMNYFVRFYNRIVLMNLVQNVVLCIYNHKIGDKVKPVVCIRQMSNVLVKTETETKYYILPLLFLWGLKFIYLILKKNSFSAPKNTHSLPYKGQSVDAISFQVFTEGVCWTDGPLVFLQRKM